MTLTNSGVAPSGIISPRHDGCDHIALSARCALTDRRDSHPTTATSHSGSWWLWVPSWHDVMQAFLRVLPDVIRLLHTH